MKKLILILSFALLAGAACCQTMESGNIFTLHVVRVRLKKDVSMQQFTEFLTGKYLPAIKMVFEDVEPVFLKGIRGEHAYAFGYINYYQSEEVLLKYFPEPGKSSQLYESLNQKLEPLREEMSKMGRLSYEGHTSWLIL
jgi:hypothetical protein